ncbi:uncharacterized protein LOC144553716 [Carex rostrata]
MVTSKNGGSFPSNFFNQPWIVKSHGGKEDTVTFIDPMAANIEEKKTEYDIKRKLCFGCIDEWLFLWDKKSREFFFLELNSLSKVHLPPLPREYRLSNINTNFIFSSSPNHSDCTVIFTRATLEHETNGVPEPFLMCCQLHDKEWTKLILDEDLNLIIGETCVIFDGKLYAYSVDRVTVFDVPSLLKGQIDSRTIRGPTLALYPRTDLVSTHFIKSRGHIYLVRMYSNLMGPIINMDIYRLDTSSDKWLMVESIGERAFFLSHKSYATSVCAIDVGVSCNCIYYVPKFYQAGKMIYKFCLDDHTMTFSLILTEQMQFDNIFYWFVPRRPRKMITKSSESLAVVLNEYRDYDVLTEEKITSNISRPWDDLPTDLFELLVPHVSLVDSVRLFAVCKAWNLSSDSIPMAKTWPWLMYHEILDGTYKLLDPLNGKEYTTKIRLPSSTFPTQMLCSKHGWVVVLGHDYSMFMINPMIQHVIKLPSLEITDEDLHGIIFTSISTSLDYIVMGICLDRSDNAIIEIHVWHIGEEKWTVIYDGEIPFCIANTNPVFLHGQLYCLGEEGELGIFNLVEKTWAMLDEPKLVNYGDDNYFIGTEDCFLLELCGDLVSVFKYDGFCDESYLNDKTIVFKLDRVKMEWIEVEDLAGWTFFLDPRSSFAKTPSPHKSWSNKIFFTSIYLGATKTCASYCMKSKRYEVNFCDTAKPLDCVWIEPNLARKCLMNEP